MLQCPPCPQTIDELDMIVQIVNNPGRYSLTPEEVRRRFKEDTRGLSDNQRILYRATHPHPEDYELDYGYMSRWGCDQNKATRHITIHLDSGCEHCLGLYRNFVEQTAELIAELDGIDLTQNPERIKEFRNRADIDLLGLL